MDSIDEDIEKCKARNIYNEIVEDNIKALRINKKNKLKIQISIQIMLLRSVV